MEIGIDCVDIIDLERIFNERVIERTFTQTEIEYCRKKARPILHFAGKFAAKEAARKALLSHGLDIMIFKIEVLNDTNGKPHMNLMGHEELNDKMRVSISHTDEQAVAIALFEHE